MKKIVLGFIMGVIFTMAFTAFATSTNLFTAQQATFDVYVSGEKFESENPAIVVEGRSYLPLRETGEALEVDVNWNGELRRVEIAKKVQEFETAAIPTPKPVPVITEGDPMKINEIVQYKKIQCDFLELHEGYALGGIFEKGGEQYMAVGNFSTYEKAIKNDTEEYNNYYIEFPDKTPIPVRINRKATEHSTEHQGLLYVKLSSLGLKAIINDSDKELIDILSDGIYLYEVDSITIEKL